MHSKNPKPTKFNNLQTQWSLAPSHPTIPTVQVCVGLQPLPEVNVSESVSSMVLTHSHTQTNFLLASWLLLRGYVCLNMDARQFSWVTWGNRFSCKSPWRSRKYTQIRTLLKQNPYLKSTILATWPQANHGQDVIYCWPPCGALASSNAQHFLGYVCLSLRTPIMTHN